MAGSSVSVRFTGSIGLRGVDPSSAGQFRGELSVPSPRLTQDSVGPFQMRFLGMNIRMVVAAGAALFALHTLAAEPYRIRDTLWPR